MCRPGKEREERGNHLCHSEHRLRFSSLQVPSRRVSRGGLGGPRLCPRGLPAQSPAGMRLSHGPHGFGGRCGSWLTDSISLLCPMAEGTMEPVGSRVRARIPSGALSSGPSHLPNAPPTNASRMLRAVAPWGGVIGGAGSWGRVHSDAWVGREVAQSSSSEALGNRAGQHGTGQSQMLCGPLRDPRDRAGSRSSSC